MLRMIGCLLLGGGFLWGFPVRSPGASGDSGHPTVEELREEIRRADVVCLVRVIDHTRHGKHQVATRMAVQKVYKGELKRRQITLYMPWTEPSVDWKAGDEAIIPIRLLTPYGEDPKPFGANVLYGSQFWYRVKDGVVSSVTGMGDDMRRHRKLAHFEELIRHAAEKPKLSRQPRYELGKVLFTDDFNDGSLAGWTLLEGARVALKSKGAKVPVAKFGLDQTYDTWIGAESTWQNHFPVGQRGKIGRIERGADGNGYRGQRDGSTIEIGVFNGRLRLRTSHSYQHVTILAGDPNWTDYQVDADLWRRHDTGISEPEGIATSDGNYCGIFGRMSVPNLPQTRGEHTELGVEFGTFGNPTDVMCYGCFQIRLKCGDVGAACNIGAERRLTKILDWQTSEIYDHPQKKPIHLTAKFMGRRVEGWIDGQKCVEGDIPESNWPQFQRGRFALWAEAAWIEYDNVKVTELVRKGEATP